MNRPILEIKNLSMRFGGVVALRDVNFKVDAGSVTALIGPNGAGKTTVFNCVTGFYKATEAELLFNSKKGPINIRKILGEEFLLADVWHPFRLLEKVFMHMFGGTHLIIRAGLARTFQNIRLFKDMTVAENLLVAQHQSLNRNLISGVFNLKSYRESEQRALENALNWLKVMKLEKYANRLAGGIPYGEARKLEIARAMCTSPSIICLDEPAAGLNPKETAQLSETVLFLREAYQVAVLLIEHDMSMVMKISDHVVVLDHGEVIAKGNPDEVKNDPDVVKAYLGSEE